MRNLSSWLPGDLVEVNATKCRGRLQKWDVDWQTGLATPFNPTKDRVWVSFETETQKASCSVKVVECINLTRGEKSSSGCGGNCSHG